ncbi:hypothetical protein TNCV_3478141 [Trichonephila clavipes]|nr:hypothetical protein TNCV_3478141 [Trichonephila clavipes]
MLLTNHSACFHLPAHSKLPLVSSSDFHVIPLLRPATTSSSTSLQPANQVASCFPSWSNHSTRQHSLFMLWDGGTLRVPCPNKSCTVVPSLLRPSNTAVPTTLKELGRH